MRDLSRWYNLGDWLQDAFVNVLYFDKGCIGVFHSRREAGSSNVFWTLPLKVSPSSGFERPVGSFIGGGFESM